MLTQLAHDLQFDPDTQARTEKLKERVLDHPQVVASSVDLWNALRRALQASLVDPDGAVRSRCSWSSPASPSASSRTPTCAARLDLLAADTAVFVVERYGTELTTVITHTIERWDGKEAARRIELHVGRDLQFIRINGTIVGGLVGVLIHAVSLVLWSVPGRVGTSAGAPAESARVQVNTRPSRLVCRWRPAESASLRLVPADTPTRAFPGLQIRRLARSRACRYADSAVVQLATMT